MAVWPSLLPNHFPPEGRQQVKSQDNLRIKGKGYPPGRLIRQEMRDIAALQRRLLPRQAPQMDGWHIAVYYGDGARPGGDYYDFFPLPDGRLAFVIADASGHGGAAAVMVAQVRTLLHSCPLSSGQGRGPFCPLLGVETQPPHVVLGHLDRILEENSLEGHFMTAFYGVLAPRSGALRYSSAGHPLPRWWRASTRTVEPLPDVGGPPLGLGLAVPYAQGEIAIGSGDVLVCYTDGLNEARNYQNKQFGLHELDAAIEKSASGGSEAIKLRVQTSLGRFLAGDGPQDDVTLLVIERAV